MHSMWKGSISFGLVNVPIKMFAATENKDIKLRYLHKECHTPVRYEKRCPKCDREVPMSEIVRGYEYQPNRFVVIEDSELEQLSPEKTRTIDILDFVDLARIDPIYFDKTYYLAPEESGFKAYALLRQAMNETGRIAIAKVIIRSSTSLASLRVNGNTILMETIFYPDEIRGVESLSVPAADYAVSDQEISLARQLIDSLVTDFDPGKYVDDYRASLQRLIEAKAQNETFVNAPATPAGDNVVDLMKALQASLDATKKESSTTAVKTTKGGRKKKATG